MCLEVYFVRSCEAPPRYLVVLKGDLGSEYIGTIIGVYTRIIEGICEYRYHDRGVYEDY